MEERTSDSTFLSAIGTDLSFGHDAGGDFSLPDYIPSIQRVVGVYTTVLTDSKFLSSNTLELEGTVMYNIIYFGDDGSLNSTSQSEKFKTNTALTSPIDNINDIRWICNDDSTAFRVTGPRAINIKSRLRSRIYGDCEVSGECTIINDSSNAAIQPRLERNSFEVQSVLRHFGFSSFDEDGIINVNGEDFAPVLCTAGVRVSSCSANTGGVDICGEICVCAVFSNPGGIYKTERLKMPFNNAVSAPSVLPGAECVAWGNISSVSLLADESDGGKYTASVDYDLYCECCEKKQTSLCGDAYSTESGAECITDYISSPVLIANGMTNLSVSGEGQSAYGADDAYVLSSVASVSGLQAVCDDGQMFITGAVKIRTALRNGTEGSFNETDIPLKYAVGDAECIEGEYQSLIRSSVCDSAARIENGVLKVSADIFLSWEICAKTKHCYVKEVKLNGEKPSCAIDGGVKVYYPRENENLWDVCKRYHADMGKILRANSIEGDTVRKGKPVIIF